jgi:hypothetical protein
MRLTPPAIFEDEPMVVRQLALEAGAVGAHARGERQPEIGAGQPAGEQLELEQRLSPARRGEPLTPLADGLDVVEPAAAARHQAEMRATQEGEVPRIRAPRSVDADPFKRNHVAPEHHRLQVEAAAVGQQTCDPGEDSAIELLLTPRAVLLEEQKCSKAPRLATASNAPKLSGVTRRAS